MKFHRNESIFTRFHINRLIVSHINAFNRKSVFYLVRLDRSVRTIPDVKLRKSSGAFLIFSIY